ncbi:MAG: alpha-hydroxy acid oxidase [Lautropia sp.]
MNPRTLRRLSDAHSIADLRQLARARLPRMIFDFIDGAADLETTARRNVDAFADIAIVPRMLQPVSDCDTSVELFGERLQLPVAITPTGFTGIVSPLAEADVARAAQAAGTVMSVSAASTLSLEAIAAASTGPKWFQQFIYRDRGVTLDLTKRAEEAGYRALIVTIDVPAPGNRYRDIRNGFTVPPRIGASNLVDFLSRPRWLGRLLSNPRISFGNFEGYGRSGLLDVGSWLNGLIDPSVQWKDIGWLRERWSGPLILKGIMHPDDARRAIEIGADAVMVSNHGGRQMDTEPATIEVLPKIAAAVARRLPILLDGGIRRGTDVIKCLALGATCVLVGRPYLWGAAAGGQAGVERALRILKDEISRALAHSGWNSLAEIDPGAVVERRPFPWPAG